MAQHDYVIANQSGAAFRADLNNGLAAIVTLNSGATAPSTTSAYMLWADTTAGLLKMRNGANNAWITLRELDGTLVFEDGTAAAPGLAFASDLNTGIYRIGADSLGISTNGVNRFLANSSGQVAVTLAGSAATPSFTKDDDLNTGLFYPVADTLAITTGGTERLRIDSSGQVGIGTTGPAARTHSTVADGSYSLAANGTTKGLRVEHNSTETRIVGVDNTLTTSFQPLVIAGSIVGINTNGSTRALTIDSSGNLLFAKTASNLATAGVEFFTSGTSWHTRDSEVVMILNRLTNDGELIAFRQAGTQEGGISVSGTTVSYNGAHLSRWSQLPGGAEREEILRGTVLSNIDEMCEWGEEDNEQLNRMKVSDVEGDVNVAGVFQAWDDGDDTYTNDFYCAMTGDFIIRIAEGVAVQRGDLLMSAGDGTAKPQDDDIIRSKTVAKVTSTQVSCTYEDGSYCVPCVLMAC